MPTEQGVIAVVVKPGQVRLPLRGLITDNHAVLEEIAAKVSIISSLGMAGDASVQEESCLLVGVGTADKAELESASEEDEATRVIEGEMDHVFPGW